MRRYGQVIKVKECNISNYSYITGMAIYSATMNIREMTTKRI